MYVTELLLAPLFISCTINLFQVGDNSGHQRLRDARLLHLRGLAQFRVGDDLHRRRHLRNCARLRRTGGIENFDLNLPPIFESILLKQIIFMGVWPNAVGIFGALLVFASVVGIALEERNLGNNSSSNQVRVASQDQTQSA